MTKNSITVAQIAQLQINGEAAVIVSSHRTYACFQTPLKVRHERKKLNINMSNNIGTDLEPVKAWDKKNNWCPAATPDILKIR